MLDRAGSATLGAHATRSVAATKHEDKTLEEARMTVSIALLLLACTSADDSPPLSDDEVPADDGLGEGDEGAGDDGNTGDGGSGDDGTGGDPLVSNVEAVIVTGEEWAYTFAATLRSPDVDCKQYSNWWEVLTPAGTVVYRRILDHSHADEQPFTRDGGPVTVKSTDALIVRGHFDPTGYGGQAMEGSVAKGFVKAPEIGKDFAADVEDDAPQPKKCLF
jgi:hypothetical protein